jgi:hypothetical protein
MRGTVYLYSASDAIYNISTHIAIGRLMQLVKTKQIPIFQYDVAGLYNIRQ